MDYYMITGASKGLGAALVEKLVNKNHVLYYISRTRNQSLHTLAKERNSTLRYKQCDLSDIEEAQHVCNQVFTEIDAKEVDSLTFINNAGMVNPIKHIGRIPAEEMIANVQLNLLTPMLLSDLFIKRTSKWKVDKTIVNITSGAANRPVSGWSTYCSTKAGLNMFTQTAGVEQLEKESEVKVIGFSPGIMDTQMQSTIREATSEDFSSIDQFKDYHEKGLLRSSEYVADILLELLSKEVENGRIYDVREFL
ncbi:(S)-benzoin forming benzil reductase [Bacillus weihaiensis]|uniref:(S)-benzoin forming benzil reductase n=1 Tax=Bacillus weihaiensis TaxID=1547283 RepID=UPI002352B00E|nr:(S)-benzoin forming benzil reductase [Bacillus weihaiensis]